VEESGGGRREEKGGAVRWGLVLGLGFAFGLGGGMALMGQ
jgi:hypothetical protein